MCVLIVAIAVSACSAPQKGDRAYRDTSVAISSIATVDPTRLAGDWPVIARFGAGAGDFTIPADPIMSGPGRFIVQHSAQKPQEHWILWVDADYRMMVLGTPDGQFGAILSRVGARRDLVQAAREMLAWNGYDLEQLSEGTK